MVVAFFIMTSVSDVIEGLRKFDVAEESSASIEATREVMIQKQRDQLLHGLKADGKLIGKYKSDAYAAKKNAQNPLPGFGNMDWKLKGDLHADIFVDVREDEFVIDSADTKTGDLIERFGDPFGLTEQSQEEYVEEALMDEFMTRFNEKTGL